MRLSGGQWREPRSLLFLTEKVYRSMALFYECRFDSSSSSPLLSWTSFFVADLVMGYQLVGLSKVCELSNV